MVEKGNAYTDALKTAKSPVEGARRSRVISVKLAANPSDYVVEVRVIQASIYTYDSNETEQKMGRHTNTNLRFII